MELYSTGFASHRVRLELCFTALERTSTRSAVPFRLGYPLRAKEEKMDVALRSMALKACRQFVGLGCVPSCAFDLIPEPVFVLRVGEDDAPDAASR